MIITIQLQTKEELQFLQPLLELLKKINAQVEVQHVSDVAEEALAYEPISEKERTIQELLNYLDESDKLSVNKIEIPSREERNAR